MFCFVGILYGSVSSSVSMMMEESGNLNRFTRRYFIHLASLMQPLSSCRENLYEIPTITARFRPCGVRGGPHGAWCGEGIGGGGADEAAWEGEGRARGSATMVMAWQIAQRMEGAPVGSWSWIPQPEQLISIIIPGGGGGRKGRGILGICRKGRGV